MLRGAGRLPTPVTVANGGTGASTAQGAAANLGVEYKLAHAAIPVGLAPTGTMANNGAATLGTALNTTYAQCYLTFPAGAIAAGVPAATETYYCTMSSATAVTVFNNTLSANVDANGMPQVPASPTAFATTGPGAFTGVTGSAITLYTMTIPAAAMGTNGIYRLEAQYALNATAGGRTVTTAFGGTTLSNPTMGNVTGQRLSFWVNNRNSASVQNSWAQQIASSSIAAGTTYSAINTANAVSVTITCNRATATDTLMVENVTEWITNQ